MFFAHSIPNRAEEQWEPLSGHLNEVSRLAGRYGEAFGAGALCATAGLFHDLGKYSAAFQARLRGSTMMVDHSTAGAAIVNGVVPAPERHLAELIGYAIAGHHAGLPDRRGTTGSSLSERLAGFDESTLDAVWRQELGRPPGPLLPSLRWVKGDKERFAFQFALLGRMVFSALVDADFKATEAFYASVGGYQPDRKWPALGDRLDDLIARLDGRLTAFGQPLDQVGRLRQETLTQVRGKAGEPPGLFTLTVPTGGGKTLTSLAFALEHARRHGKRRIIYAIPYTAIIDQTAQQFRDILGDEVVLEHHSAVELPVQPRSARADSDFADRGKLRLAMEDWAAPVVVTTNVQLFESLFASRTSAARKLHNIAQSVIVLDEAQTLPRPLLLPILRAIEALARDYGVSIVLCTATQPALDMRHLKGGLALEGRELAPDPARLARELKRVTLRQAGSLDDAALVEELAAQPQGLVIVNSRRHALALFRAAQARGLDGLVHLSTRMCAAHRQPLLERIKARLSAGEPCRVISTSLIEAGVDVDFPRLWRAEAGLDQIAQAAGRCNREGRRAVEASVVTLFTAPDHPPPAEIRGLVSDRLRMQGSFDDLFAPDAMTRYFEEIYWRVGVERLDVGRADKAPILGKFAIDSGHTEFSYRSAAENFRMIESGMVPVIVPFDDVARAAIGKLSVAAISSGRLARDLQLYTVQVPPGAREQLLANGKVAFRAPDLRADQFAVLEDEGLYDKEVGLIWEDADYLGIESLVLA